MRDGHAIAESGRPEPLAFADRIDDRRRVEAKVRASGLAKHLQQLPLVARAKADADRIKVQKIS